MTEPTDGHEHAGAWCSIFVTFVIAIAALGTFVVQAYQIAVIYDRVGEMQRQLECPLGELLVADHDGVEYCLDPVEEKRASDQEARPLLGGRPVH